MPTPTIYWKETSGGAELPATFTYTSISVGETGAQQDFYVYNVSGTASNVKFYILDTGGADTATTEVPTSGSTDVMAGTVSGQCTVSMTNSQSLDVSNLQAGEANGDYIYTQVQAAGGTPTGTKNWKMQVRYEYV